ncbi:MAG: hypothetical protein R3E96_13635 [Planctomycetota bacterium]
MAELHRRGVAPPLEWVGAGLVATDEDYAREVLHQAEVHRVSRFIEWADTVPIRASRRSTTKRTSSCRAA